jgi:predicted ATPase/predicted Ser/Thr protein kinase
MIGTTLLNRYEIESELGKGGMGIVYKAHDTLLHRAVAIKFLNTEGVGTEGKIRLLQEARAAAQLNHPNIVSIYDAGETGENSFIVMELVNGDTLRKTKKPTLPDVLTMAQQICLALDHAHANGIIHRDLKLENIVITNTQTLKLMDFGLARTADDARLTEEGVITGTLAYIAPELIQGQPASPQSDLYAFGVILYEILTGQSPFQGTLNTILSQHLHAMPKPPADLNPQIPLWLNNLVLQLLNKLPEERPASAKEVLSLLNQKTESPAVTVAFTVSPKSKNNLPAQLTSFIGRENAIKEVEKLLIQHRLVTLTGSGGTGKTRLSLQLAEKLFDQFEYIWFVELAPITDPGNILSNIFFTIGLSEQQGKSAQEILVDYLREKNTLIILDNCEHLIEASAKITDTLLNQSPLLKILASSREALAVKGEIAWHVPSLSLPDLKHLPELNELAQHESIRLFTERATLTKSNFSLTKENASFVAQICSRLDGIPLAIELAASRIKTLNVEQIATRLDDRFRLLTGGARTALPRQQTLRATIDWSYNMLSEQEKALLAHLCVFSGGWTLEAAEQVCSQDGSGLNILDLLTQLADKSLVNVHEGINFPRYHMLETTRQYAREKLLDSGEGSDIHDNHLRYFLEFAEKAAKEIHGSTQAELINLLEDDHDNFRGALEWGISAKNTLFSLRLFNAIRWGWFIRAHYSEIFSWFEKIRILPEIEEYPLLFAKLLNQLGQDYWTLGKFEESLKILKESQTLCLKSGTEGEILLAEALSWQGWVTLTSESDLDIKKSEDLLKQGLALYEKHRDLPGIALTTLHIGYTEMIRGQGDTALGFFEQSRKIFQQIGDLFGLARVFQSMAFQSARDEKYEEAKIYSNRVLAIDEKLQFQAGIIIALNSLATIYRQTGDFSKAIDLYNKSISISNEYGFNSKSAHFNLALLALHQNNYAEASQKFIQAFKQDTTANDTESVCVLLMGLAAVAGGTNQLERSATLYGAAQTIFDATEYRMQPFNQKELERHIQLAREQLGSEEFTTYSNEGRAMTREQAIQSALGYNS